MQILTQEAKSQKSGKVYVKLDKKIPADTGVIELGASSSGQGAETATPAPPGSSSATSGKPAAPMSGTPGASASDSAKTSRFDLADYQPTEARRLPQVDQVIIYMNDDTGTKGDIKTPQDPMNALNTGPVGARVFLSRNRPSLPAGNDVQSRIEFQLQQIQLNQLRLGQGP